MKEVEEWNIHHGNKNENISTEENRTDRYQIGKEMDFIISKGKEHKIRKR